MAFEKVPLTDQKIEEIVEKMVKEHDKNPAVYGYYVKDEPSASLFPLIAKIGAAIDAVCEVVPQLERERDEARADADRLADKLRGFATHSKECLRQRRDPAPLAPWNRGGVCICAVKGAWALLDANDQAKEGRT